MKCLAVLFVLSALATAHSTPLARVIGGRNALPNEFPYMVSLTWVNAGNQASHHNCGGSILNARWILTAAHCLTRTGGHYLIRAGAHLIDQTMPGEQTSLVTRQILHPDYNGTGPDDIALMELQTPLTFSTTVQPVNLPVAGVASEVGLARASGWGAISTQGPMVFPNILQTILLPVLSPAECRSISPVVTDRYICTSRSGGGHGICTADSGGPLVRDDIVEGVVAWGSHPCGGANGVDAYARVSAYIPWINAFINN